MTEEQLGEMIERFRRLTTTKQLAEDFEISRLRIIRTLRDALGEEYTSIARKIMGRCGAISSEKRRGVPNPHSLEWNKKIGQSNKGRRQSEATKKKIGDSVREQWNDGTRTKESHAIAMKKAIETKRQNGYFEIHSARHSSWMLDNAPMRGKQMSEEAKKRMSDSKRRFFALGGIASQKGIVRSEEQRLASSKQAKRMWQEGKFDHGNGLWRSKLESSVFEEFQKFDRDCVHSFKLKTPTKTFVYDVHVPSLNLIVEVNGDYWHLNPRIYDCDFVDEHRNVTAKGVWDADNVKRSAALASGFKFNVLWEAEVKTFGIQRAVSNIIENHS